MLCLPKTCRHTQHAFCLQGLVLYLRDALLILASPAAINLLEQACFQAIKEAVSHSWLGSRKRMTVRVRHTAKAAR